MCGIVGYVGHREAVPVLIKGLERLEYRGYDSAGLACLNHHPGGMYIVKEKGKLAELKKQLNKQRLSSNIGIGHTRWATHGEPSRINAHPHADYTKRVAIVHNGIIENHAKLKEEMSKKGIKFKSATDTEVAANLIGSFYKKGELAASLRKAVKKLQGYFAFVVLSREEPDKIVVFKRSNPLVIGIGDGENFIASDVPALLPYTQKVIYLEDDEYAIVSRDSVEIYSLTTGKRIQRRPTAIRWNIAQAAKGGYRHFMLKEIHEQPAVLEETHRRLTRSGRIHFDTLKPASIKKLKNVKRAFLVSCGTAWHASLVGGYMFEELVRMPSKVQVSSEFRYGDPLVGKDDLAIFITQSGETADTLAAMREAKEKGAFTLAIVNVLGSTIAREADAVIYTHAGPEIGVASTKAYIAQLATLSYFSIYMGSMRGAISREVARKHLRACERLSLASRKLLKQAKKIRACAKKHYHRKNFLYLGRSYNFPTALEGALKLKEITYAHAHGYAAGEMKHGPIALIDRNQVVSCILPQSKTYDKMLSNIEEIRARDGIVVAIGTEGDKRLKKLASDTFEIAKVPEFLSPILTVIPLQIFAYEVAVLNGRDVDQPRNLAKSVTVE